MVSPSRLPDHHVRGSVNETPASFAPTERTEPETDRPARTWIEAMENSECLFGRYASTKDEENPDIQ